MLGSTIDCSDHRREPRRPPAPDEGWRLIQAFTNIKDPALRNALVAVVETLAEKDAGRPEVVGETEQRRPISA